MIRTLDFKIRSDLCEYASGGEGLAPKPADSQTEKERKIWPGGGGGGGGGGGVAKHLTCNLLSSTDDFWGFTSLPGRATVYQMSSNSRHTIG